MRSTSLLLVPPWLPHMGARLFGVLAGKEYIPVQRPFRDPRGSVSLSSLLEHWNPIPQQLLTVRSFAMRWLPGLTLAAFFSLVASSSVTYNQRSFEIDGVPTMLLGGSFHYPRTTSSEWPQIFSEMKANGLNLMQTYVFWDIHIVLISTTRFKI